MASTIAIYTKTPGLGESTHVGTLAFDGFLPPGAGDPYGLRATFHWITGKGLEGYQEARWIWLEGEFSSSRPSRRRFGSVLVSADQLPPLDPGSHWSKHWLWHLTPEEVEAIEVDRATDPPSPPFFSLRVRGIVGLNGACYMVDGEGQVSVALSDWQQQLTSLGYAIPLRPPASRDWRPPHTRRGQRPGRSSGQRGTHSAPATAIRPWPSASASSRPWSQSPISR